MKKIPEKVARYDKRLYLKHSIDGSIMVHRRSPFKSASEEVPIMTFKNIRIGSGRWLRSRLIKMDTQRFPHVQEAANHNMKIRLTEEGEDRSMAEDIADFIETGGEIFIN